jgi:hypothetical protein
MWSPTQTTLFHELSVLSDCMSADIVDMNDELNTRKVQPGVQKWCKSLSDVIDSIELLALWKVIHQVKA